MAPKSQRTYNIRVTGIRPLGYIYAVRAATKEEAHLKAHHEYRMETGDVVLRTEDVKLAPTKNRVVE